MKRFRLFMHEHVDGWLAGLTEEESISLNDDICSFDGAVGVEINCITDFRQFTAKADLS